MSRKEGENSEGCTGNSKSSEVICGFTSFSGCQSNACQCKAAKLVEDEDQGTVNKSQKDTASDSPNFLVAGRVV